MTEQKPEYLDSQRDYEDFTREQLLQVLTRLEAQIASQRLEIEAFDKQMREQKAEYERLLSGQAEATSDAQEELDTCQRDMAQLRKVAQALDSTVRGVYLTLRGAIGGE